MIYRDQQIFELLCRHGELSVQQLSDFAVSSASGAILASTNILHRRTHGAALSQVVRQLDPISQTIPTRAQSLIGQPSLLNQAMSSG
jgi:hypothetical protein